RDCRQAVRRDGGAAVGAELPRRRPSDHRRCGAVQLHGPRARGRPVAGALSGDPRLAYAHRGPARLRRHAALASAGGSLTMSALLSKAMAQAQADAFHPGEQAMQLLAGSRARMAEIGQRVIRDFMPDQHRELFEKLPYLFVGSLDAQGRPWASMLVGRPGFVQTPDERHMIVAAKPAPGDRLADHLRPGAPVAVIGIELHTRRRNRMNGRIAARDDDGFTIQVDQSFGNCPQYIQARQPFFRASPQSFSEPHPVETESALLSAEAAAMVRNADTFFIATASASAGNDERHEGVDVSHRGGRPGFVRVTEEDGCSVLTAPDFAGNNFFNT